jgi:hypothetical protein
MTNETTVRKRAEDAGLMLRKSRSRDPHDPAFGGFMVIDPYINGAVAGYGPFAFSLSLEEADDWLNEAV